MKTKKITGVATAALLASVVVPVTNNLANIETSYTVKAATSQQVFLNTAIPDAEVASAKYGTYTSVMLAQAILESGWGASSLATQANNLFGMKGSYNGQTYYANTAEWASGTGYYNINAGFRKYPSWEASFEDNGYLLRTGTYDNSSRYRMAWIENAANYQVATQGLKDGGYATDPNYPQSLNNVIQYYGLNQYDPSIDNTTRVMRVSSNGTVYSGPATSSVVRPTGSVTAGQVITVDKTITYKNGMSYMHTGNGWISGSLLFGGSSQSPVNEQPGTSSNSGSPIAKITYSSPVYVWEGPNKNITSRTLSVGSSWKIFGKTTVNGETWYNLGGNQWILGKYVYATGLSSVPAVSVNTSSTTTTNTGTKPSNFVSERTVKKVNYVPGYGIMLWKNPGSGMLGRYLEHGSRWQVYGYVTVNGNKWYNLGGDQWADGRYLVDGDATVTGESTDKSTVSNFVSERTVKKVNYVPGYGIMLWKNPGSGMLGRYLEHGSR
ncbi:glycoside hydrolase family 73 protein, partial [Lactobacillus mulieris]